MELIVLEDHEAMSRAAVRFLTDWLEEQPASLFCLASGSTPDRTYRLCAQAWQPRPDLTRLLRVIKLDEWGGIPMSSPATCEHHLRTTLIDPLQLSDRYQAFRSDADDPQSECERIAHWLAAERQIDVSLLGLGLNGHVGFNEPADVLQFHAHTTPLSETSMQHVMLAQGTQRPTYGITLGMADLLQSRAIVLLVSGSTKREPLRRLLTGPIDPQFPASLLRLHPRLTLLCDRSARNEVDDA